MEAYDYRAAVRSDVDDYLRERADGHIDEDRRQELEDEMFVSDSVTGNASGSYTFSTWKAEENLCHNWDLIAEAAEAFGIDEDSVAKGAEYWDCTVRCYLLNQVLTEAVAEWNKVHPETEDEADDE